MTGRVKEEEIRQTQRSRLRHTCKCSSISLLHFLPNTMIGGKSVLSLKRGCIKYLCSTISKHLWAEREEIGLQWCQDQTGIWIMLSWHKKNTFQCFHCGWFFCLLPLWGLNHTVFGKWLMVFKLTRGAYEVRNQTDGPSVWVRLCDYCCEDSPNSCTLILCVYPIVVMTYPSCWNWLIPLDWQLRSVWGGADDSVWEKACWICGALSFILMVQSVEQRKI